MTGTEMLYKMELISPTYIDAADLDIKDAKAVKRKSIKLKRLLAIAACLCLLLCLAVPVAATSAGVQGALYDILYAVSPATAQYFKPVQMQSTDNGIRMEVTAAYVHESTAEIYIAVQDLEKTRFDETVDLFDSYSINTPFDCASSCRFASFDNDTKTATFLITIEQWQNRSITGDKITFTVAKLLPSKKTFEGVIDGVSLTGMSQSAEAQTVEPRGSSGKKQAALKAAASISTPASGVTITAMGYVDGALHIQAHYDNIRETDNHGEIYLTDKATSEIIRYNSSLSFFDSEKKGVYQDYIFEGIDTEALDSYELYGSFMTSDSAINGDWSVTFPLENTENAGA